MSADLYRKAKAALLLVMLGIAETRQVQQDGRFKTGSSNRRSRGSTSSPSDAGLRMKGMRTAGPREFTQFRARVHSTRASFRQGSFARRLVAGSNARKSLASRERRAQNLGAVNNIAQAVDKLVDRTLYAAPVRQRGLDRTTLGKPGQPDKSNLLAEERVRPPLKQTLRQIAHIAIPNVIGYLLTFMNEFTNVVILGHLPGGTVANIAAVGLGNMMQNCISLSVGIGLVAALDTFVSQAYGAGQDELSCEYLQRARVLATLQLLWMIPILFYSDRLLMGVGELLAVPQDKQVAQLACDYNRAASLGIFSLFQFEATRKFLQNRRHTIAPPVINGISTVLHVAWCVFFVHYLRLGNAGAGYANAVTWTTNFLLGYAYLWHEAPRMRLRRRAILWIERPAFREWKAFLRTALPTMLAVCSEWWYWEINAFVVGALGTTALAAHVATLNFIAITIMPVIGIQASAATLVGNSIGEGRPRKAKQTAWACVAVMAVVWTGIAALLAFGRRPLASMFTGDLEVQSIMHRLLCIFAVVGFVDSTQNVMAGALRGLGKQHIAAMTYFSTFYGVMLPLGIILAFKFRQGVDGIWYSMGAGTSLACVAFAWYLQRTQYGQLAAEAAMMFRGGARPADEQGKLQALEREAR